MRNERRAALIALVTVMGLGLTLQAGPGPEITNQVMLGYISPEDPEALYDYRYVTEDVVFMDMARGEPMATGREELERVIHRNYNVSFEAQKSDVELFVGDGKAVMEWTVVGTHIGDYAGIPGTGSKVEFPIVGVYELEEEWPYRIKLARIYVMESILLAQITQEGEG